MRILGSPLTRLLKDEHLCARRGKGSEVEVKIPVHLRISGKFGVQEAVAEKVESKFALFAQFKQSIYKELVICCT